MEATKHELYMRRAISLARHGLGSTSPNPMVGAVVVCDGRIIGEGFHRRCGEGHAEVNAIASVKERELLSKSTIYVTLEPCSHYGKTPPCSKLIIESGIPEVVVGCQDPSDKVSGRGIAMLREAGVKVTTGILEDECRAINPIFMTSCVLKRPYVTLKWAQSNDGFMDRLRNPDEKPTRFSTSLTSVLGHRLRTLNDAIMVGAGTVRSDNPRLDARLWHGNQPVPVIATRSGNIPSDSFLMTSAAVSPIILDGGKMSLSEGLSELYSRGITSLLVEGGAELLSQFINEGLWDEARIEVAPFSLGSGIKAPVIAMTPTLSFTIDNNRFYYFINSTCQGVKKV